MNNEKPVNPFADALHAQNVEFYGSEEAANEHLQAQAQWWLGNYCQSCQQTKEGVNAYGNCPECAALYENGVQA